MAKIGTPKGTGTPDTSRRALLRRSGGMLAASAVLAVGSCTPTLAPAVVVSPDAELLGLCADFLDLQAALDPILAAFFATPEGDLAELGRLASLEVPLASRQDDLADKIVLIQAHTQEGMAAKAAVAKALFRRHYREAIEAEWLSEENAMVWSLFQDLTGRA